MHLCTQRGIHEVAVQAFSVEGGRHLKFRADRAIIDVWPLFARNAYCRPRVCRTGFSQAAALKFLTDALIQLRSAAIACPASRLYASRRRRIRASCACQRGKGRGYEALRVTLELDATVEGRARFDAVVRSSRSKPRICLPKRACFADWRNCIGGSFGQVAAGIPGCRRAAPHQTLRRSAAK